MSRVVLRVDAVVAGSDERAAGEAGEVLYRRPELCISLAHGTIIGVMLAPIATEWLPDIRRAVGTAFERRGGPLPMLSIFRLDPRFPIVPGFDSNLAELRETLVLIREQVRAIAVVIEFDGLIGGLMRRAVGIIAALAGPRPPQAVHTTAASGAYWLASHDAQCEAHVREILAVVRGMKQLLGCEPPSAGRL